MIIVGFDEVGRGCWAGPLLAGAVILKQPITGLADSKLLSRKQREQLAPMIKRLAVACGLGWVWPDEIDALGLTEAVGLAMDRALAEITSSYDQIIIDGNINYFLNNSKAQAIIKADVTVPSVSAASIIAKVARDEYMRTEAHDTYPGYGFDQHVGYGTAMHRLKLEELGVSPIHRKSYKPVQALLQ